MFLKVLIYVDFVKCIYKRRVAVGVAAQLDVSGSPGHVLAQTRGRVGTTAMLSVVIFGRFLSCK